jgi:hypothetical protein
MPLVAYLDGKRVDATRHTKDAWSALKESQDRKRLVMPQCGIRAVPKTVQGTQFFAHHRTADCLIEHKSETPQHLAMKSALAQRIEAMPGWHALVEYPHPSREWIIDVLAESHDRRQRIAFEVQLSSQTLVEYNRRSQRYFESDIFPVWLVPRDLEYSPIKLPVVSTGFSKSSEVPDDISSLMELETRQQFLAAPNTLGPFLDLLLQSDPHWTAGTPAIQEDRLAAAAGREQDARNAAAAKIARIEQQIEEMNDYSSAPEKAFGAHTVQTHAGPFVWATLTGCWKCDHPMLLWEAKGSDHQHTAAPALQIKSDIRAKRYENHPDVHRVVDQWIRETKADIGKAHIELRRSKAKGAEYSAFVCPSCNAIAGQIFIAQIRHEHWSLISAPQLRKSPPPHQQPRKTPVLQPGRERETLKDRPTSQRESGTATAQWARAIREKLDRERANPTPEALPSPTNGNERTT